MPRATPFTHHNATLLAEPLSEAHGPLRLVWLHGWASSREALRPLAQSLAVQGESWLIDLPGHANAPLPPHAFSPIDYAHLLNSWLATLPSCPTVILGHSMGFRVALHATHQNAAQVVGLVSLGGAGIPRPLSLSQWARRTAIRYAVKAAKKIKPLVGESLLTHLRQRFGSTDYLSVSPALRPTFLAVVNDNATALLPHITQSVLLVYGAEDTETPPNLGAKFQRLLPHATLHVLKGFNHYTLLSNGRHQVAQLVKVFMERVGK